MYGLGRAELSPSARRFIGASVIGVMRQEPPPLVPDPGATMVPSLRYVEGRSLRSSVEHRDVEKHRSPVSRGHRPFTKLIEKACCVPLTTVNS